MLRIHLCILYVSCTTVARRGRQDAFQNHFNFLADQGLLWGHTDGVFFFSFLKNKKKKKKMVSLTLRQIQMYY